MFVTSSLATNSICATVVGPIKVQVLINLLIFKRWAPKPNYINWFKFLLAQM